ncbi:hypothetical protein PO883_32625 [Massilia sp. DJPM01]|uniref:hypothetical protein n=1 Tax=Massilia sp. DJPM01 TaxID=3024404 RepID=UPI00259F94FB|nr:hypothetical protein [Massilia sp. DJPM01]MDM5181921.1 hypothetical protein [Massilia sp. DJPM01]
MLSNLGFLLIGLTAFGSSWYHLAPDDTRLVWDRLPIALACVSLPRQAGKSADYWNVFF